MTLLLLLGCFHDVPIPSVETGATDDTDQPPVLVENDLLSLRVDDEVVTMVRAEWDGVAMPDAWIEVQAGADWVVIPAVEPGRAVILGLTEESELSARLADASGALGEPLSITTGSLPSDIPRPEVEVWEPTLSHAARYAMISVQEGNYTFEPPYWILIFERETGDIVWYREVPDQMLVFYPSVALDGTHLWHDAGNVFGIGSDTAHVRRQTLDGRWSTRVELPDLGQAIGEGPDLGFFYERRTSRSVGLARVDAEGASTLVWDCADWADAHGVESWNCYMNATNWSEATGTVLTSMFYANTVFEIDVESGEPVRQVGQLTVGEGYEISPADAQLAYQHFPVWTDDGTLLVSTHVPGEEGLQVAVEYAVDDETRTFSRVWSYTSTDRWATQLGEALRLDNGNTVQGYGQDGAVREVSAEGETAWEVSWEKDYQGYRVVGHVSLIDDLYALNEGPATAAGGETAAPTP